MPEIQKVRFGERAKERAPESAVEQSGDQLTERQTESPGGTQERTIHTPATQASQTAAALPQNQELHAVESILAEGLDETFMHLSPAQQLEFKKTGEATAQKILDALRKHATRIKDVVRLIVAWLKTLPGINRFFLEQEAKIKADKIFARYRRP